MPGKNCTYLVTFGIHHHTMKIFSILFSTLFLASLTNWGTDMEEAKKQAKDEHKYILLNFSGSDWCGPCIRLHKEIFGSDEFKTFADQKLVLVNADFPRLKKNQLSKEQQAKNDKLADKYNSQGNFPYTVLLNEEGKVVKAWEGYPNETPAAFTAQIKSIVDAGH